MFVLEIIKAYNYPAHIDTQPEWLYNGRPITWNPSDTSREAGCIVGLIAARLAHNPRYDEIKDTLLSIMTHDRLNINEDIRQSFLRVADYLDGM